MITKKFITDELNKLRQIGYDVKTFNSNRKMPTGARDFVDHVLKHPATGNIFEIEVKTKNDNLSKGQNKYRSVCIETMRNNNKYHYYLLTDDNWMDIIESLWRIK